MFSSISKATPQTQASTGFTANRAMTIVPVTPMVITVNGQAPANATAVAVSAGDLVTATIVTPDDWLWHDFYYYEIDGVPQSFAVINKSSYVIKVKPEDALKRWYLYTPLDHTLTYKSTVGTDSSLLLGSNYSAIDETYHVVLNPLDNSVYFYGTNGIQLSKVVLPAVPIDYAKIPDKQSVVVLVTGGESYEIFLNNSVTGIAPFYARRNYSEFTDLGYIAQLPGEDLITYLRRARSKQAIPPATCVTYNGIFVIAAGNGSVWIVDPMADFKLIGDFPIDEFVLNIAPLPGNTGVLLVTQSHKIYVMDIDGNMTELYQGTALWQPALFNGKVYIPESNTGYLKVYNPATAQFEADIDLLEFSPSYTTVVDNKMYVCGHDSERVLVFDTAMNYTELYFPEKVTTVSAAGGTVVASHWLKNFTILDQTDLRRIVKVEFKTRSGPVSHIGTNVVSVRTLGNPEVYARTPTAASLWVNGRRTYSNDTRGTLVTDGDIISLSYAAKVPGLARTNCIIGDIAYDYDTEAVTQTYYPRNIELEIQAPGTGSIHTRVVALPTAFSPSLISVEYGTLKVNEAYYYGNFLVGSNDIVKIEIDTRGNSALPVLTIGARQFVIPVSTNPGAIAPTVFANINLTPSTPITQELVFDELPSLFDYIIPGYYNVTIKKNTLDITGNYYQQFGKGDKMVVEYTTSPKLYDETDVYVLGSTNYKFTAKNTLGFPIDYLDYGNIVLPYTRVFDPYDLSLSSVNVGAPYNLVKEFAIPEVQFITANLTVSGLAGSANANISVVGGDSYFVVNGNIESNINVSVINGDQLGIARNVVSYHDVPVTVVQHLPTGDEDGWADVIVGNWNIVNRDVAEPITTEARNMYDLSEQFAGIPAISSSITVIDSLVELNRLPARNLNSYRQQLDSASILDAQQPTIGTVSASGTNVNSATQQLETYPSFQTDSLAVDATNTVPAGAKASYATLNVNKSFTSSATPLEKIRLPVRVLNSSVQELNMPASVQEAGSVIAFNKSQTFKIKSGTVSFQSDTGVTSNGSEVQRPKQASGASDITKMTRFALNVRAIVAVSEQLVQTEPFIFFDRKANRAEGLQGVVLDGNKSNWSAAAEHVPSEPAPVEFDRISVNAADTVAVGRLRDSKLLIPSVREALNKNIADLNSSMSLASQDTKSSSAAKVSEPMVQLSPEAMYNYITPLSLETNAWIDLDSSWQGFVYSYVETNQSIPGHNSVSEMVEKFVPPEFNYLSDPHKNYITPAAVQQYHGQWEPLEIRHLQLAVTTADEMPPMASTTHIIERLRMEPRGHGSINFMPGKIAPGALTVGDTSARIQVRGTLMYYTFADMIPVGNKQSDTTARVLPGIDHLGTAVDIKQVTNKFQLADPARHRVYAAPNIRNAVLIAAEYESEVLAIFQSPAFEMIKELPFALYTVDTTPAPADAPNTTLGYSPIEKSITNLLPQTVVYSKAGTSDNAYIDMDYVTDRPEITMGAMRYDRNEILPITKVIPTWAAAEYGLDAFVIYKLQHQQQNDDATNKIRLARDVPNHYFTYITTPELNNGILWDHDISVPYGAFATEADAIYAARNYTEFRPYLIMDTDLWSYRVILDTGLICPLPKGRYPIAWLIRGG